MMKIQLVEAYDRVEDVRQIFAEYTAWLLQLDPKMQDSLDQQHYEDEILHLEVKYGKPHGRLYLACIDGRVAGCAGLRQEADGIGEVKRLFVRPAYRGHHVGKVLLERIIGDAKAIGYTRLVLDTMPQMAHAVRLYTSLGFRDIPKYNDNPVDEALFLGRST